MRVLVVSTNRELTPYPVLPLGACLVASTLEVTGGHEVSLLDLAFSRDPAGEVRSAVRSFGPDAVGLSVRNIDNVDYLAPVFYLEAIRAEVVEPLRAATDAPVVAGGPGFSIEPEGILRYLGLSAGVVGDGEQAFLDVVEGLGRGERAFAEVPGAAWVDGEGVFHQNERAYPPDLDALPFSRAWRWLDVGRYSDYGGSLSVQTKRGCALRCAYCVYNTIEGRRYRTRSPASLAEELVETGGRTRLRDVDFTDSTFNAPLDHAKEVLETLARLPVRYRYQTSGINPGFVDEEFRDLLVRAGFGAVMVTAEAASDRTLEGMQKGFDKAALHRAVALLRELPMKVFWYFLLGGPGENAETVEETLAFLREEIPPEHLVYFGVGVRIQRGAPIEARARAEGLLAPGDDLLAPRYYFSPGIEPGRLLARVGEEVLRHPNYIQSIDYQGGRGPVLLARLFSLLRLRRPSWSFVPTLFRWLPFLRRRDRFSRSE